MDRHKLRWNGWGRRTMGFDLGDRDERVWTWLRGELGCELAYRPAMPLADISMPEPGLAAGVLALLAGIVGPEQVKVDRYERAFHARGKSYADLVALRAGDLGTPPDAVIYPRTAEEVERVLALADGERIAVIPYGGGTSVVGGVASLRGPGHVGIITVDMSLMNRLIAVDRVSHTATLQAGMYGPDIEHCLQARGFTLGHYPQSFELSTLGGWIAARGAGQLSSRYGKAEDWLVCARLATPRGPWHTAPYPASAAGPDLNQIIAGSEGTLGIITEATVRIRPVAEDSDYRGYLFRSFSGGLAAAREIAQERVPVAMLRLSDVEETRFFGALSAARSPSPLHRIAEQVLAAFGYADQRCLLLVGLEGDKEGIKSALARTRAIARKHGAFPAGRGVGESWYEQRFQTPYLRDPLLDRGVAVETLETATTWATIPALHHNVLAALNEAIRANLPEGAARGTAMSHISHVYEDGASLYFTLVFPQQPGRELEQWGAIKRAATDAIVAGGGTISHHHGVGLDHAPWLAREKGPIGVELLAAIKGELDPHGTLNPGKLVAPRMRPDPDSDKDT